MPKGERVKKWGLKFKCNSCGHDKFVNIRERSNPKYDKVYADCAKCGSMTIEDGPCH